MNNELLHKDFVKALTSGKGNLDEIKDNLHFSIDRSYKQRQRQIDGQYELARYLRQSLIQPRDSVEFRAAYAFIEVYQDELNKDDAEEVN